MELLGLVSSFIEPDKSTTKAMSRGLTAATAEACWLIALRPKSLPKNRPVWPPLLVSVRTVTFTAVPTVAPAVKFRAVASQLPNCTSAALSTTVRPATW